MDIFGTKALKNLFFRIKSLPKVIFEILLPQIFQFWRTFQPKSKQTADLSEKKLCQNDQLLMFHGLASIVFLYHYWNMMEF